MSSFDQKFDFDREFAGAKGKNAKNVNTDFELRMKDELQKFSLLHKKDTPEYIQFQRSIVAFALVYDMKKHDLGKAFEKLATDSKIAVKDEIDRLKGDITVQSDYRSPEWYRVDMRAARAMNVKSTVIENIGDTKFDIQKLTPEKRQEMEKRPFKLTSSDSWKETGMLLGEEGANSIKDIALFFGSIPGSLLMLGEYIRLRSDRTKSLKNEATLALMLDEFPALALVDLASDWDKAAEMLKLIASKLATGNQGDVAFTIVNTLGLFAGGALVAGKAGSLTSKMSRIAQAHIQNVSQKIGQNGGKLTRSATVVGTAGSMALGGVAYAGEAIGVVGAKFARVAGAVDNVASGQSVLSSSARGLEVLAKGKVLEVPRRMRESGITPEEYTKMVEKNSQLDIGSRSIEAAKDLGLDKLSTEQTNALQRAHDTGTSGAGEWTHAELRAKYEALKKDNIFTHDQARTLLERGYAGSGVKGFITKTVDWIRDVLGNIFSKKKKNISENDARIYPGETQYGAPLTPPLSHIFTRTGNDPKIPTELPAKSGKPRTPEVLEKSNTPTVSDKELQIIGLQNEIAAAERGDIKMTSEGLAYRRKQLEELIATKSEKFDPESSHYRDEVKLNALNERKQDLSKQLELKKSALENLSGYEKGKSFSKVLHFDHRVGNVNKEMRIVKYHDGKVGFEVKDGDVFRPIEPNDSFIPKTPDELEKYNQYMKHQEDLFQKGQGVRNITDTPDSLSKEIADLQSKLDDTNKAIDDESKLASKPENITQDKSKTQEKLPTATKAIPEPLSFRRDVNQMMKMDDATFQKNFTDAQYKNTGDGRPFEKEIYEGVANVRKLSDAIIIARAQDILKGNRDFMRANHPNLGSSELSKSDKARMIAENAALRNRLTSILGKTDPSIPKIIEDIAKTGDTTPLIKKLTEDKSKPSNLRRFWPLLLLPLLLLAFCNREDKEPSGSGTGPTIPPTDKLENMTPIQIAELCKQCATGTLSQIDIKRKSQDAPSLTLNQKTREEISKRWMSTKAWKDMVDLYNQSKSSVQGYNSQTNSISKALDLVIGNPSMINVQLLQRCIAMDANDTKSGQDGILGPITTKNLLDVINVCRK